MFGKITLHVLFYVIILWVCTPLSAETSIPPVPERFSDRYWEDEKRLWLNSEGEGADSVFYAHDGVMYYYNLDSLCYRIATCKPEEIAEELWFFYFIVDFYGPARREIDRVKIVKAIDRYHSEALKAELDVFDLYIFFRSPLTEETWERAWALIEKYEHKHDLQTKLRLMQRVLYFCSGFPTNLVSERIGKDKLPVIKLFTEILATVGRLEAKGEYYLIEPGHFYRHIGLIYYNFRFYDKAVPLLWKTLDRPVGHFYNRNIMIARDYLGDYYRNVGDYALSDSLYLSMLESPENVLARNTYDAVAIGGLAANANLREEKNRAMDLYAQALSLALRVKDFPLAGGYAVQLARLFLEKEELQRTRELLEQARDYLTAGGLPIRNWEVYYTLNRDYYLKTKQADIASLYIDSIATIQAEKEEIYNSQLLNYAEQKNYEEENGKKEEQLQKQKTWIMHISRGLFCSFLLLAIVLILYHRQRRKNYALFQKIMEQDAEKREKEKAFIADDIQQLLPDTAEGDPTALTEEGPTQLARQRKLFISLRDYLLTDRNFARADIDVPTLITELSTNRSYLFGAIKTLTGNTLQEYINHLRLEEAKKLLENTDDSIEEIALMCGYNTVRTFYRLFHSHYNISPAAYRRMFHQQKELIG
ncbi:AraC family transcriptional regulator [Parabacteroides sp. PF5-6]|uniref:AraC family transcriptional regulator n=1 Tax=Parabacteroides sp. PF5-6 TaxID=1742403 RepID=UPI0024062366|nr:AraC family transcriptional regulator [Parabacteroides sp. PF5-6]MDF9830812.1 AraC-like DNA-binding protein/tetratricopeptide (TPR) repeat protein [Parabacteroides sp. PF5-6]